MWTAILLIVYCLLIAGVSLFFGLLSLTIRLTHTWLQIVMSFVGGLILGVALLHMLPHALVTYSNIDVLAAAFLVGVLSMFFLMRVFHIHHHEPINDDSASVNAGEPRGGASDDALSDKDLAERERQLGLASAHHEGHHRDGHGPHCNHSPRPSPSQTNWIGLAIGFALHTLMDGVALAASVKIASSGHTGAEFFGFGIFLAIFLHKPLDAMSITWIARADGWPKKWIYFANVAFALMCPLGVALFFLGFEIQPNKGDVIVAVALAFSAGVFVCISLSDILPEVSFHSHDRAPLSVALVLGVVLAWSIGFLEPDHVHSLDNGSSGGASTNHVDDVHGD